jgi:hypothetical protein
LINISVRKFGLRVGIGLSQSRVKLKNLGFVHDILDMGDGSQTGNPNSAQIQKGRS